LRSVRLRGDQNTMRPFHADCRCED